MVEHTLEQGWEILRHYDLQKMPILAKKKAIFSDEAHFGLGGYVNKKIVAFGTQKPRTRAFKSKHTQNGSLFGADFGPKA